MSSSETEPKGSGDSSPDDKCQCGHARSEHSSVGCRDCMPFILFGIHEHAFVSAGTDTEPAGPECPCIREGGCCHAPGVCLHDCREAADEVTRLGEEMEHPEPEAPEDGLISAPHPYGSAPTVVSVATSRPGGRRPPYAPASGESYERREFLRAVKAELMRQGHAALADADAQSGRTTPSDPKYYKATAFYNAAKYLDPDRNNA